MSNAADRNRRSMTQWLEIPGVIIRHVGCLALGSDRSSRPVPQRRPGILEGCRTATPGDLEDFLKFGLLRQLATGGRLRPAVPALGWCGTGWRMRATTLTESTLGTARRATESHSTCVVSIETSTTALARSWAVENGASQPWRGWACSTRTVPTSPELVDLSGLPVSARTALSELRTAWVQRAVTRTTGCDLVFVDPNNGLRSRTHKGPAPSHQGG